MRVLLLHNRYRQFGGEDAVVTQEMQMLRNAEMEVFELQVDQPSEISNPARRAWNLATTVVWSSESYRRVHELCRQIQPDVAHVHNFWMTLSPSVHKACHDAGVATVQTLHNFRLVCPNALLLRDGKACQDCLGKVPWRGVVRRCYRSSFAASGAVAAMSVVNRARRTWQNDVDAFIALSKHSREKFLVNLPSERIFVKPNFVDDPGPSRQTPSSSDTVVFAGRLSGEKGLPVLLEAWAIGGLHRFGRLLIVGDGPDRGSLEAMAKSLDLTSLHVSFAGSKTPQETIALIGQARCVVLPSICYENAPRLLPEAFSNGRGAVVSAFGALSEQVEHGRTGLTFPPGNSSSLGEALKAVLTDPVLANRLGDNARREYLKHYTPEVNLRQISAIYRFAIERRRGSMRESSAESLVT